MVAKPSTRVLLPLVIGLFFQGTQGRRGALVRDGFSSKVAYDNPRIGQAGDITLDPDVVAITSRCANWSFDPVNVPPTGSVVEKGAIESSNSLFWKELVAKQVRSQPLHVTFRSRTLAGGKRPNWMRATAVLGDSKLKSALPLRAVWTCSNPDADPSMSFEEQTAAGRSVRKEIGKDVMNDSYEDCLKRLYGKYVELEVLLPKTKKHSLDNGGPPPSLVYRVPINSGHVNPFGMVSKSRATVTLYPKGRTLPAANARGPSAIHAVRDFAIPLGVTNVHLPLGPGLVDPGWVRGKKLFWKGRSVGLI